MLAILNPGVPPWVALPCNLAGGVPVVLLLVDPAENFASDTTLAVLAAAVLYGTAAVRWLRLA